jgi:hypothetical protein
MRTIATEFNSTLIHSKMTTEIFSFKKQRRRKSWGNNISIKLPTISENMRCSASGAMNSPTVTNSFSFW